MPIIVDSQNIVSSLDDAPDGLRAEIGSYFSPPIQTTYPTPSGFRYFNTNINKRYITNRRTENGVLIPVKKALVLFTGKPDAFRDQTQWKNYVNSIVVQGVQHLDHQFTFQGPQISNSFHKNYHNPEYEDFTKEYGSNFLLNYNLISYPNKELKTEEIF